MMVASKLHSHIVRPNLIMIITDEHNLRTLGCYRDFFVNENQDRQAYVWGDNRYVETPFIDSLAAEGALFTNFYTVAPLCTPSRASFMTGLFPQKTGSESNHGQMNSDMETFATVLRLQKDYKTGYFGKWHLNGSTKPGWGDNSRKFGFEDTHYQWNRGHWKFLNEKGDGTMEAFNYTEAEYKYIGEEDKHFATDFLFDRGIEFMDKAQEQDESFAFVLSIPDPHVPNDVRPPYWVSERYIFLINITIGKIHLTILVHYSTFLYHVMSRICTMI
jgi:arylsulfatase A-like enzyme